MRNFPGLRWQYLWPLYTYIFVLLAFLFIQNTAQAQKFEIRDGQFMLNDTPIRIYGGEMHYARIPREYWQQRIQMAKAMGCNALSIYVMWNYQETAPGVWDWKTENHDLRAFVETAKAEGMYIILRPGPYVCAEWDFGGFPYWMADMKLRSDDPAYLDSCSVYLKQVFKQVDGLFAEQGGNILMTQVENEYGSFSFDMQFKLSRHNRKKYLEDLAAKYREAGFKHTLFTCDGGVVPVVNFARLGHINGLFPGTNDSKFLNVAHHTVRKFYNKNGPYYIPEEYPGWFTHWGDAHMFHRDVQKYKTHIEQLLKTDFSFCYYMIHGGTNFGFRNGANTNPSHQVQPVVTSYDYGAPIDEAGNRTPLYDSLRAVYQRATNTTLPPVPAPIPSMAIDSILLEPWRLFSSMHGDKIETTDPLTFEQLTRNSSYTPGYVLYTHHFTAEVHGNLFTDGITDYALIYVNDSLVATINRDAAAASVPKHIMLNIPANANLKLLVENMGRINFGRKLLQNKKGITKGIFINNKWVKGWTQYLLEGLPLSDPDTRKAEPAQPVIYKGTFTMMQPADTYLNMKGFGKGAVWVNGHNLGRYWEIGPQYSLYVPGVWLRKGQNTITIFDEINHSLKHYISTTAKPVNN